MVPYKSSHLEALQSLSVELCIGRSRNSTQTRNRPWKGTVWRLLRQVGNKAVDPTP